MALLIQIERLDEATRRYYVPSDICITPIINWDKPLDDRGTEPLPETEPVKTVEFGGALLAIEGIAGIVLWPRTLQVRISQPKLTPWEVVEPKIVSFVAEHLGENEVELAPSPQDPSQF